MRELFCGLVAGATLALTGCSASLCDRATDVETKLNGRVRSCVDAEGDFLPAFDTAACVEELEGCSEEEQAKVEEFYDCLTKIEECSDRNVLVNAYNSCLAHLAEVGATCRGAFGFE